MAINPLLLNVKPISEITTVDNPIKGHLLFYDGSDELKKVDIIKFQSLIGGIAKPLAITDATPTTPGWYKPTTSGTYANAGGLVAQDGYDTLFYFDGTTWSKVEVAVPSIANGSVTPEKTNFAKKVIFYGKNRFNKNAITSGKRVNEVWGNIYDESGYSVSEFIPVDDLQGKNIAVPYLFQVAFYTDTNESSFISGVYGGGFSNKTVVVPSNAKYAVFSIDNLFIDVFQVEEGTASTSYEAYKAPETKVVMPDLHIDTIRKYDDIVEIGDGLTKEVRTPSLITTSDHEIYRNDRPKQNLYIGGSGLEIYDNSNPYFYGNVAGGYRALANCDASMTNVALGNFVLEDFGKEVNPGEPVGADCTGVGDQVMRKLKSGVGNSGFGKLSLAHGTLYTNCSAYGDTSLEFNNGNSNNAFGYSAGIRLKYGKDNCLFGTFAGGTAIPDRSYYSDEAYMASYNECTAFGNSTMQFNKVGSRNAIFGHMAGHRFEGVDNCFFGAYSFRNIGASNRNTGVGNYTGMKVTTGNNNVFIGYNSGNVSGQKGDVINSIVIGYNTYSTKDNQIVLGNATNDEFVICGVTFTKTQIQALKDLVS